MNKYKFVEVDWIDIQSESGWFTDEEIYEMKPAQCKSFGFLVKKTDEFLILAAGYDVNAKSDKFGDISCIPISVVKKVRTVPKIVC